MIHLYQMAVTSPRGAHCNFLNHCYYYCSSWRKRKKSLGFLVRLIVAASKGKLDSTLRLDEEKPRVLNQFPFPQIPCLTLKVDSPSRFLQHLFHYYDCHFPYFHFVSQAAELQAAYYHDRHVNPDPEIDP